METSQPGPAVSTGSAGGERLCGLRGEAGSVGEVTAPGHGRQICDRVTKAEKRAAASRPDQPPTQDPLGSQALN